MAAPAILIVDDEREFLLLLRIVLEQVVSGAEVGGVERADEALAEAAATQPDLILLDVHLPDEDGGALVPRLRNASPGSMIVLMSSDPDTHRPEHANTIWVDKANLLSALPSLLSGAGISG